MARTKSAARVSGGQRPRPPPDPRLEEVLQLIQIAKDSGITANKLADKVFGEAKPSAALKAKLKALVTERLVQGPVKYAPRQTREDYYFAAGHGPTPESVGAKVAHIAQQLNAKPPSEKVLKEKLTGIDSVFLKKAIQHAVDSRAVMEITVGRTKVYLHRDCAVKHFGKVLSPVDVPTANGQLTFDAFLVAYGRLKSEQRGLSTVNIMDLLDALEVPKETLHQLLVAETKAGRVTIHPDTTGALSDAEKSAGIRLPGFAEPFVTVVVKNR